MKRAKIKRLFSGIAIAFFVAILGYLMFRPWLLRWGATDEEVAQSMPGDLEHIGWTRAITIDAPPEEVWPWLIQWGQGRGGWYSYDWLENLFGFDIHTADRIVPEYQNLSIGDSICMARGFCPGRVTVLEPQRWLGWQATSEDGQAVWTFLFGLSPVNETATRLVVRESFDNRFMPRSAVVALEIPDVVMELKALDTVRHLAEGREVPEWLVPLEIVLWFIPFLASLAGLALFTSRQEWKKPLAFLIIAVLVLQAVTFLFPPLWLRFILGMVLLAGLGWYGCGFSMGDVRKRLKDVKDRPALACICFAILFLFAGCTSTEPVETVTESQPVREPATPTPEVFIPLDPSPTPLESSLPMTCQITDLNVYVDEARGYCFAYPLEFRLDETLTVGGKVRIDGPALDDASEPLRVSLEISVQPVPDGSDLGLLVDAYLSSFKELPWEISRESMMLGGEPAEKLEPVPGLSSSRVWIALHHNQLITMRFNPSDIEAARSNLDSLTQSLTGSFSYLPATMVESTAQSISWYEFGRTISLSYDTILAPWVDAGSVPAVPVSDQMMYAEAQPAYARFRFLGFQGGRPYELPLMPYDDRTAQVRVFRTDDFTGYGDEVPEGFPAQLQALREMLDIGVDPARCAQPYGMSGASLPYLPWINQQQVFCAQPQVTAFAQGKGVRYITYFAQGPGSVLDGSIFYTFQGLTADGQFYVAAFFPLQTGIFPMEEPPCPRCGQPDYDPFPVWEAVLKDQVMQLNALPAEDFDPSLNLLDSLVQSIRIE